MASTSVSSASGLECRFDVLSLATRAPAGSEATAVAYVETTNGAGDLRWGVGEDPNIITASFKAVISALIRQQR